MRHIPYGYDIVKGKAVINEEMAEQVRTFFQYYLEGKALTKAAELAGMKLFHGSAGRMLRNKHYLGDEYYPQIIDKEIFDKVEEVRIQRATNLGRVKELKADEKGMVKKVFTFREIKTSFTDPFKQAEYMYGLIESEVLVDGSN